MRKLIAILLVCVFIFSSLPFISFNASAGMPFVQMSESYGGTINVIIDDDTYIYAGGNIGKVYQYWKSNLTKKAESAFYGGWIAAIAQDDTYIYAGGTDTCKVYQYWKSNLTKKAETSAHDDGTISNIAVDDTYIYAGGGMDTGINRIFKYQKSDMAKVGETADYGGTIRGIVEDGLYIYIGGGTIHKIFKYQKSDMAKVGETADYGGTIQDIVDDGTYIYTAGIVTQKVYQYWLSNLTKKAETLSYGDTIQDIVDDGTYIYAGGNIGKVYQYWKSNLTKKAETTDYGDSIYALAEDDDYVYVGGPTINKIYQYYKFDNSCFAIGDGTADNPYRITNADELNCTHDDLGAYYILMNDIDLAGCENWNGGEGFIPIGTWENPFVGSFDGQNHTITNLFINNAGDGYYLGLFGYIDSAVIMNIGLEDPYVDGTWNEIGGLIGYSTFGTITNCYITGEIYGGYAVGGLIGACEEGTVTDCYSTGNIIGDYYVGGLIGSNGYMGEGIAFGATVTDCYSTGGVEGISSVGGLIGTNIVATVTDCYATGYVEGTGVEEGDDIGGLIGYNYFSSIHNCNASGEVYAPDADYVGGLIGHNDHIGGATVRDCHSTGDVTGYWEVGGLIGHNAGDDVINCYSTGNVIGIDSAIGGLIGENYLGSVHTCFATGDIYAPDALFVGGLIGISGEGGLTVMDCYARGDVTGDTCVGGLLGIMNTETVLNCYSTGYIDGDTNVGGLIGYDNGGSLDYSYWDTQTSGQLGSDGGTGRTTAQMTYNYVGYDPPCEGLYEEWDLGDYMGGNSIWVHDATGTLNDGYPLFRYMFASVEANFTYLPLDPETNETIQFTDSSTGNIVNWSWNFGDGDHNYSENPQHIYDAAGNYTVTLNVTEPGTTDLTLLDTYDGTDSGVWCDGTYIYTAGEDGISAYTFDGSNFILLDNQYDGDVEYYYDVWGDGTYIYAACSYGGIRAYTFDGEDFTLLATQYDGDDEYWDVWGDGTYIYTACTFDGLRAYSFNGLSFTLLDTQDGGDYAVGVWGDGTYIYEALVYDGISAYTFSGSDFTLLDNYDDGDATYVDIWGDGTYIYAACGATGIRAHTFSGSDFTLLDTTSDWGGYSDHIWGDGTYIYTTYSNEGPGALLVYSFNGDAFTPLDYWSDDDVWGFYGLWGDDTYIYATSGGIRAYQFVFPGDSDSISKIVTVTALAPPIPPITLIDADFIYYPNDPMVGETVSFTDQSTGNITSWSWDFGDGDHALGKNQQHRYNRIGTFTVTLEVSDGNQTDRVSKIVTVRLMSSGPHVIFPVPPAYPDNPYTVPEMYELLHASDLPVSSEHIKIVFLDSGFTPREYEGVDLSTIYGMKSSVYTTTDDRMGHGTWISYAIKYITDAKLPNAEIISYRVFDDRGFCDSDTLLAALDEIEDMKPDIVSFSGGAYGDPYDAYSAKVEEMRNMGIIVVVAAGNEGPEAGTLLSPGCSNGAMGIGAIDPLFTLLDLSDDVVCEWSSRGPVAGAIPPKPDFASPGESIIGPWLNSEKVVSGTSLSTPLVAGGTAVVYANNKLMLSTVNTLWGWLIPNIIPDIVEKGVANTAYQKGDENSYGYGIPDFQAASNAIYLNCILWISLFGLIILCFVMLCVLVSYYFKAKKCPK